MLSNYLILFTIFFVCITQVSSASLRKADLSQAQSLASQIQQVSDTALRKFQDEIATNENFGRGLPKPLLDSIVSDSTSFWSDLGKISAEDIQNGEDGDVEKARTIIEAVAEIDDDLSHPEKAESVLQRYSMLKDELNYV